MSTKDLEPRVYEVGYHILPIVGEADLDAEVNLIRDAVTKNGGELIKEGSPRLIDLAYPMTKVIENKKNEFTRGYFGWMKFAVTPDATFAIKEVLDGHANVLRFIMISTVREDTIIGELPLPSEKKEEKKDEGEIDEVKLDKEIDDMVSEE